MPDLGLIAFEVDNTAHQQIALDDAFFATPVVVGGNNVKRVRKAATPRPAVDQFAPLGKIIAFNPFTMNVSNTTRTISGVTRKQGINTSGILVKAFNRTTGDLVGSAVSGAGGAFTMTILGYTGDCTVLAYDGDEPPVNAAVVDDVVPV